MILSTQYIEKQSGLNPQNLDLAIDSDGKMVANALGMMHFLKNGNLLYFW